ncbi:MAG TPA: ABC transporter permease [Thermoanaerobaculia bacterium]
MKKALAVFKREYLQAVRKKMFIIMTLLMPFLMAALMFIPAFLMVKTFGGKKVAIIDGTGQLDQAIRDGLARSRREKSEQVSLAPMDQEKKRQQNAKVGQITPEYVDAQGKGDPRKIAQPYVDRVTNEKVPKDERLDGVLIIPGDAFDNPKAKLSYFSRSSTDFMTQERLSRVVNRAVQRHRFSERGVDAADLDRLLDDLGTDAVQVTKSGQEKKGGEMNFLLAFVFILLLLMPVLLYGQEVMRGIIQEKTDRVVELLVSSITPMELLFGKVIGLAAVSLTQLSVWIGMALLLALYGGGVAMAAGMNVMQFVRADALVYFVIFFLLGYLLYVCVYAVGGACVNNEKEAQQLLMPIILFLMLPYIMFMPIMMNPDGKLAVVMSMIPFFTPIAMFSRILVSEPPLWQILVSILLTIATIWGMFWIGAKIFRVGILSYGKRPTLPELWRWLKLA